MNQFQLDPRLAADCLHIHETPEYILLLMNNGLIPWLILVPRVDVTEWFELDMNQQQQMMALVNRLSAFMKEEYALDKLNIATIGNIVSQLHIHIVGRRKDDVCWPGVVWGMQQRQAYSQSAFEKIASRLREVLADGE